VELLGDTVRLREERKKCKQNRDKYTSAYGNESYDFRYQSRTPAFDEIDDFPASRRKTSFVITEDDFKDEEFNDDAPYKATSTSKMFTPSNTTTTMPAKPRVDVVQPPDVDDFAPFVEPTPNISNPWDPFSNKPPVSTDSFDDFNPRSTTSNPSAWPSQPPIISTPINPPLVTQPPTLGPIIGSPNNILNVKQPSTGQPTTIHSNLFVNTSTSPNTIPNTHSNTIHNIHNIHNTVPHTSSNPNLSNPSVPDKPNIVIPKSNDPWANQHLFNLSPRNNPPSSANSAKTLGATVGSGWDYPPRILLLQYQ